jgi:hypothetical protein
MSQNEDGSVMLLVAVGRREAKGGYDTTVTHRGCGWSLNPIASEAGQAKVSTVTTVASEGLSA